MFKKKKKEHWNLKIRLDRHVFNGKLIFFNRNVTSGTISGALFYLFFFFYIKNSACVQAEGGGGKTRSPPHRPPGFHHQKVYNYNKAESISSTGKKGMPDTRQGGAFEFYFKKEFIKSFFLPHPIPHLPTLSPPFSFFGRNNFAKYFRQSTFF